MTQTIAIQQVLELIQHGISGEVYKDSERTLELFQRIQKYLHYFLQNGIDYKLVVDALDDSIYITDAEGKVLYVNPAYEKNTGIKPEEVLGRKTQDIVEEGKLFTGGATLDVLRSKKKAFRLSTVQKKNPPEVGYTIGVPIFDEKDQLQQIVVSSRPILSLHSLQQDYTSFLAELQKTEKEHVRIYDSDDLQTGKLIGTSSALGKVHDIIKMAAPTDATILVTGESGVGKEVVADEIYSRSDRSNKRFIKVNCASIPANLLESELFGYEKGAFSGANTTGKRGLFEEANGGTLMLDEIGDMSMDLQVKLLRAIQNKTITRVGGTKEISLDIRFIAATNCDLKKRIAEGTFRQDLYYRLNVIPIPVPPLRDRPSDVRSLIQYFVDFFSNKHHRNLVLSDQNMATLLRYSWPGNVRELENVIEYLTICASGGNGVDEETLMGVLDFSEETLSAPAPVQGGTLSESVENYEKSLIESVLANSTSLRDAGSKLGINASTISRKIKQYGIEYPTKR